MPASPDLVWLVSALPTPHLLLSPALVIEAVSEALLLATRTQREHLVGQYLLEVFPDNPRTPEADGSRNLLASLQQVLATKQPHRLAQQRYAIPDPERPGQFMERYWQAFTAPMLDPQGQVQHLLHATVDVTAEVQAQVQLLQSQAAEQQARAEAERQRNELRSFVEQAPVAVAVYRGPQHRIELANATTLAIWGRTLSEVLGRPVFEVLPEAAVPEVVAHFDQVYITGQAHTVYEQATLLTRHGQLEEVYWNFVFQPDVQPDGRISGIRSIGTDVSAQVRARQQVQRFNQELETRVVEHTQQLADTQAQVLAAAERRVQEREKQQLELQRLFEQAPMAIVVLRGPTFIIEQVNEAAEAIWGRTAAQVLERPHFEAVPDAAGQGFEELLAGVLETGEAAVLHEVPVQLNRERLGLPDQGYYSIIFKPLRDEHQRVTRIAIMWTEATDQVVARQQVLDLNQELAAINEELHATNEELHASNT
jgi:PAS domain S-box-containing protein